MRDLVHVHFASEMIRSRGKPPIRALPERRLARMKVYTLMGNIVQGCESGASGVVVVKLPGGEHAVFGNATLDIDDTGGPEVRVRELVLPGPHQFHRLPCLLRNARRFDCRFASML